MECLIGCHVGNYNCAITVQLCHMSSLNGPLHKMGLKLWALCLRHVANANRNEKCGLTLERNRYNSYNHLYVESHTPSNEGFIQTQFRDAI
jgi:hypothetical protein